MKDARKVLRLTTPYVKIDRVFKRNYQLLSLKNYAIVNFLHLGCSQEFIPLS